MDYSGYILAHKANLCFTSAETTDTPDPDSTAIIVGAVAAVVAAAGVIAVVLLILRRRYGKLRTAVTRCSISKTMLIVLISRNI